MKAEIIEELRKLYEFATAPNPYVQHRDTSLLCEWICDRISFHLGIDINSKIEFACVPRAIVNNLTKKELMIDTLVYLSDKSNDYVPIEDIEDCIDRLLASDILVEENGFIKINKEKIK